MGKTGVGQRWTHPIRVFFKELFLQTGENLKYRKVYNRTLQDGNTCSTQNITVHIESKDRETWQSHTHGGGRGGGRIEWRGRGWRRATWSLICFVGVAQGGGDGHMQRRKTRTIKTKVPEGTVLRWTAGQEGGVRADLPTKMQNRRKNTLELIPWIIWDKKYYIGPVFKIGWAGNYSPRSFIPYLFFGDLWQNFHLEGKKHSRLRAPP